jgi:hypothetical protein
MFKLLIDQASPAILRMTGREFANAALEALELGRQIAVDLKSDADFDKCRCGPDHECFLVSH